MSRPFRYSINLFIAAFFSAVVIIFQNFSPGVERISLKMIGLFCFVLAAVLISLPFFQLNKYGNSRPVGSYMHTNRLVSEGIYSIVRHPQYLGYMLLTAGFSLLNIHWVSFLCCVAAVFFYNQQIIIEEKQMIEKFGQSYLDYMETTPKLNFLGKLINLFLTQLFHISKKKD